MKTTCLLALLTCMSVSTAQAIDFPEALFNRIEPAGKQEASLKAKALHQRLLIADLHADPLLWDRDLLQYSETGHMDIPRLQQGNVAVQVFGVVSKVPFGMNVNSNPSDSDQLSVLMMVQGWPRRTWFSVRERAIFQAEKLATAERDSKGTLSILRSRADLDGFLDKRRTQPRLVAGLLALEGVQPLEGQLEALQTFHDLGFRMMGLVHFFDNEAAGSAHGETKGGLTPFGKQLVDAMQEKGIIVDLAHASARTIDDVTARARKPVIVSHTGVRGTCDTARNLDDAQLRKVAATGGVIGIGYWPMAACSTDPASIARAIRHAVSVVGAAHVALGSDFNGAVPTGFDTSRLELLTQALLDEGLAEADIAAVMGDNAVRILKETLP